MCSCDPPLAHERKTVLDSYFDAAAERPAGGGAKPTICYRPGESGESGESVASDGSDSKRAEMNSESRSSCGT